MRRFGPFRLGRHFYAERSPRVSGLKLFGHWLYSRSDNVSCFSLCGLARWRIGRSVYVGRSSRQPIRVSW